MTTHLFQDPSSKPLGLSTYHGVITETRKVERHHGENGVDEMREREKPKKIL